MADSDILQVIAEARVDAKSLSEFMYKPISSMVERRLAPSIRTLNYYVDLLDSVAINGAVQINQAIINSGFIIIDSFGIGATLTQRNQALRDASNNRLYRWSGDLPKVVPPSSTPVSTGGVSEGNWLLVDMNTQRNHKSLSALINYKNSFVSASVYTIESFYFGQNTGGGQYVYNPTLDKAKANGGSIIDPSKVGSLTSSLSQSGLGSYLGEQGTGVGMGCLVRIGDTNTVEMFGGLPNRPDVNLAVVFKKMFDVPEIRNIQLLEGTYYAGGTATKKPAIVMPSNSTIQGKGWGLSELKTFSTASSESATLGSYGTEHVTVKNLRIDGNKARHGGAFDILGEALDFDKNVKHATVENVWIRNAQGEGLDIDGVEYLTVNNLLVTDCEGNGVHISDPLPPKHCNLSNIVIINCAHGRAASVPSTTGGMYLRASGINFNNVFIMDCSYGIVQNGASLINNELTANNFNNIYITNSTNEDMRGYNLCNGFNISNFVITRGNEYPVSIDYAVGRHSTLTNGQFVGGAEVSLRASRTLPETGLIVSNVIAPDCDLTVVRFGAPKVGRTPFKISDSQFRDVDAGKIYGGKFEGMTCENLAITGGFHNNIFIGNRVYNNITTTMEVKNFTSVIFALNHIGGTVTTMISDNPNVTYNSNIVSAIAG